MGLELKSINVSINSLEFGSIIKNENALYMIVNIEKTSKGIVNLNTGVVNYNLDVLDNTSILVLEKNQELIIT